MTQAIKSQPLKWHGGKSYLAKWIHSKAPPSVNEDPKTGYTHRNISFFGGGGEWLNWLPIEGISEAVNDLNYRLTTFWQVLRDPKLFPEFCHWIELSPFSDREFRVNKLADDLEESEDLGLKISSEVNIAIQFFIRYRMSRQGLGKDFATPTRRTRRGMNENVSAWLSAIEGLPECHERLQRVEIRNLDFREFIRKYDHERALFYLDPPYLHETRSTGGGDYEYEMSVEDHADLLDILRSIKGKFMLSGYRSEFYDDWSEGNAINRHVKQIDNKASSKKTKPKKIECLWCNY